MLSGSQFYVRQNDLINFCRLFDYGGRTDSYIASSQSVIKRKAEIWRQARTNTLGKNGKVYDWADMFCIILHQATMSLPPWPSVVLVLMVVRGFFVAHENVTHFLYLFLLQFVF